MYSLNAHNWHPHRPHFHAPKRHDVALRLDHMVHDPRFWAVLALVAVTVLVITLAILTAPEGPTDFSPYRTIPPYGY